VYLEGDCAAKRCDLDNRTRYCGAYEVDGGLMSAMRCYGIDIQPAD
jgi:hypothetical protein